MANVKFNITANPTNAIAGFSAVEKSMSKVDTAIKGLGSAFVGFFAFSSIKGYLSEAVDAYAKQERAILSLESALGKSSKSLQAFASEMQSQTRYGDEAILQAQALTASFTRNEEQIRQITKASADLATAFGMDLNSAMLLVTKSIFSSTNALSRYGIGFDGAAGSADRFNSAIKSITTLVGGRAEEDANTFSGRLEQMKNEFGDLTERIASGGGVIEALNIFFEMMKKEQGTLEAFVTLTKALAVSLVSIVSSLSVLYEAGKFIPSIMGGGSENANRPIDENRDISGVSKVNDAFKKITDAFQQGAKNIDRILGATSEIIGKYDKEMPPGFEYITESLEKINELSSNIPKNLEPAKGVIGKVKDEIKKLEESLDFAPNKKSIIEINDKLKSLKLKLSELENPSKSIEYILKDWGTQLSAFENKLIDVVGISKVLQEQWGKGDLSIDIAKLPESKMRKLPGKADPESLEGIREMGDVFNAEVNAWETTFSSSMKSAWADAFGEANSLLEMFLNNFAAGLIDAWAQMAAQKMATEVVPGLIDALGDIIGFIGGGGTAGRIRDPKIDIKIGDNQLAQSVYRVNNAIQRKALRYS